MPNPAPSRTSRRIALTVVATLGAVAVLGGVSACKSGGGGSDATPPASTPAPPSGLPSSLPSSLPSDLPSDLQSLLPSDLPSDIPTDILPSGL